MASINLSGILTRPDGEPDVGAVVTFTHFSTTGTTVKTSYFELIVPPNGAYNIDLEYGNVRVDYASDYCKQRFIAIVTVNQDNPATSIPELLNASVPVAPDVILEMQALLADTVAAKDIAVAVSEQITTTELINQPNTFSTGDVIETSGFTTKGDGGGSKWQLTAVTGTPSQTPAQLGDALLNDALGRQWKFIGKALFVEQIGGKLDGSDNTGVLIAAGAWSNSTKGDVNIGVGTMLTDSISFVADTFFSVVGTDRYKSIIKLNANQNDHVIKLTGASEFKAKSITFDQNCNDDTTQTAGHCIRSGGCNMFHLEDVLIRNTYSYGIGLQAGTSRNIKWRDIEVEDCGQDCIDVKDYNLDNDVIDLIGFTGRRFGKRELQQVAIDVRGPANISNLTVEIDGLQSKRGLRLRVSSGQGRGGSGALSNIKVTGIGANDGQALDIASDTDDFVISNVECNNVQFALVQGVTSVGGQINGLVANGLTGTDCIKFQGSGMLVNGVKAENTAASSRIYEFTPSATGNRLTSFILKDNSGNASAGRIQAGATNNAVTNGDLYGGSVNNLGTNTDLTGLRLL